MIELHRDCRAQLIETIADAISSLVVTNGKFIGHSVASLAKLSKADNVIPTSGKIRDQLTSYINETPVSTFVRDQLQSELLPKQYQQDRALMNLTEIAEYKDQKQVAERLVDQISSLPWQYKLTIRLPQQLAPLLPSGENSIALSDQVKLVRVDHDFQRSYPLETEEKSPPSLGLFGIPLLWETSAEYMQITTNGFIGPYGGSTPAWSAESILRAFCGLGIALTLFNVTRQYTFFGPFGPKAPSHFIIHRQLSDQSWRFEQLLNLNDQRSQALDTLEKDFDTDERYALSNIRTVFSGGPKADLITRASEWFLDSYTGHDELLSYVQAMVVLEILLGDEAPSDEISLRQLLGNRCAYLISRTQGERAAILDDFGEIYKVRSKIVHRGKSRLAHNERVLFWKLQRFCHRVIYKEIELLKTPAYPTI